LREGRFAVPALAAACSLLVLVSVAQSLRLADTSDELRRAQAEMSAGPSGGDATTVALTTRGALAGANGSVRISDSDQVTLELDDVPAPPAGKSWQAWAISDSGEPTSLGTVHADGAMVVLSVPERLQGSLEAVALTLEPREGSVAPTSDPIAYGELAA
jgi:anti-sigma-K factor RskA